MFVVLILKILAWHGVFLDVFGSRMVFRVLCHGFRSQRVWSTTALREGVWIGSRHFTGSVVPAAFSPRELQQLVDEARMPRKPKLIGRTPPTSRMLGDGNGLWRCADCGVEKVADDFSIVKGGTCVRSYCKLCASVRAGDYRRTLRGNADRLVNSARNRSRLKGWAHDLHVDFILDLILKQDGRCAYSGIPMEMRFPHSDWRMSLERLSNEVGYQQQNCVLVAAEFNTSGIVSQRVPSCDAIGSSKWSKKKVHKLRAERLANIDLQSLYAAIREARVKGPISPHLLLAPSKSQHQVFPGQVRCSRCGLWKHTESFYLQGVGLHRYCKDCVSAYNVARRLTLRGHVQILVGKARQRHKAGKWTGDFELDLDSVLDMLWSQQGRCFYSGVPMRFAQYNTDWMMSLERLDNKITYSKDNAVLIALEFNTPDNTPSATTHSVSGSSQWSRSKVKNVWGAV